MNCPHCKSGYTELKHTYEDLDCVKNEYYCTACSKRFTNTSKKKAPQGELVMELLDGGSSLRNEYDHIVRFYLTSEGTLTICQKSSKLDSSLRVTGYSFVTLAHMPKFKTSKGSFRSCSLEYNSFRSFNDSKGTLFSVRKLTMHGAFLQKANGNEAMRILLKPGFLDKSCDNEKLINDAACFLNSLISSYPLTGLSSSTGSDSAAGTTSSGGCYVATCVYGSYDCPEVWTLRRYRDNTLGATWYGRLFIRTYYAISPTIVKLFGNTKWFKRMWRGRLDRMVKKLQDNGIPSTPYNDKSWE